MHNVIMPVILQLPFSVVSESIKWSYFGAE